MMLLNVFVLVLRWLLCDFVMIIVIDFWGKEWLLFFCGGGGGGNRGGCARCIGSIQDDASSQPLFFFGISGTTGTLRELKGAICRVSVTKFSIYSAYMWGWQLGPKAFFKVVCKDYSTK